MRLTRLGWFGCFFAPTSGPEALALIRALQPDVAVIDPKVPDGGPSLVADICQEAPACAVLVLTSSSGEGETRQALSARACSYLDKNREPSNLVRTIERISAGSLHHRAHRESPSRLHRIGR